MIVTENARPLRLEQDCMLDAMQDGIGNAAQEYDEQTRSPDLTVSTNTFHRHNLPVRVNAACNFEVPRTESAASRVRRSSWGQVSDPTNRMAP